MKTQRIQNLVLGVSLALVFAGCSKNSSSSNTTGSVTSAQANNSTSIYQTTYNGMPETLCSGRTFQTSAGTFSAQAETYISNGVNGTLNGSSLGGGGTTSAAFNYGYVRVHITGLPTDVAAATANIAFFSYSIDASGNPIGETITPFFLENYTGTNTFSPSTNSVVNQMALNGISLSSTDFVLQLPNPNAAVINIAIYASSSTSAQAIHNLEFLTPGFYTNPNTYATNLNHTAAQIALHPLASYKTNGYSDQQYVNLAQQFCF